MKKFLNFLIGAMIIFLVQYFSQFLLKILHIAFPAPILGIIILFILLKIGFVKEKFIKDFCEFLLKYMILFFIPLFVGLISYSDLILKNFLAIIATIFITTTLVMVAVGVFSENVIKYKRLINFRKRVQK